MLLHRCNRCGMERHNRIAADDNPIALLRLAVVQPRRGRRAPDAANADEAVA